MGWVLFDAVKAANLHNATLYIISRKRTANLFDKLEFDFNREYVKMSLISFGEAKHHVYQDKNQDDFICIRFMCHLNHEQNNHYAKNQKFSNGALFHINWPLEFRFV